MKRLLIVSVAVCLVVFGMSFALYAAQPDRPDRPARPTHPDHPAQAQNPIAPIATGQPGTCLDAAPGTPTCQLQNVGDVPSVCCSWDTTNTSTASKYSLEFDVSVDTSDPVDCVADVTDEISFGTADFGDGSAAASGSLCIPLSDFSDELTGTPVSAIVKVKGLVTKNGRRCRQNNMWSAESAPFDFGCVVPTP